MPGFGEELVNFVAFETVDSRGAPSGQVSMRGSNDPETLWLTVALEVDPSVAPSSGTEGVHALTVAETVIEDVSATVRITLGSQLGYPYCTDEIPEGRDVVSTYVGVSGSVTVYMDGAGMGDFELKDVRMSEETDGGVVVIDRFIAPSTVFQECGPTG